MPTISGGWELMVILSIILLLFGAKKLPSLASSMGQSLKEFRRSAQEPDIETESSREP